MSEWQKVKIGDFLEKKSICAESLDNYKELKVLGVSNKLGITITSHKKSFQNIFILKKTILLIIHIV